MKKHILIVEDERIVAEDIKMSLERLGHQVCGTAHSGEEAISKAQKTQPDLVLMDIVLQGKMDGVEVAQRIRSLLDAPIIYLTAYSDHKTLERAKVTEPFGYIIKPFDDRELHSIIEIALYKHRIEKKLRESEEWLSTTLNSIGDAVIATDRKGNIIFMNPAAENLTGWTQDEAEGMPLKEVFVITNEETGEPIEDSASKLLGDGISREPTNQATLVTKNKRKIPIIHNCAPIILEKRGISGAVLVFQDMSERKKTMDELKNAYEDLKKTQHELIQSEKLAALGRFSAGVAHEIKNPLGIILSGAEFLEMKLSHLDEDVKTAIKKMKDSVTRANAIVQDLLKFARPSSGATPERIRPQDLIDEALSLLKFRIPLKNIKIKAEAEAEDISVDVDRNQMLQVLLNLLMNAIDAMPKGGRISVKTYKLNRPPSCPDSALCIIEVKDTGEGIPEENLPKIFEPFFSTKRDKKGTGLGLFMTKMIVDNHKGSLEIESRPGAGTTVRVALPLARSTGGTINEKENPDYR